MLARALSRIGWASVAMLLAFAAIPLAQAQTPTYNTYCQGCHGTPPSGPRWNAAAAGAVITAANSSHPMGLGPAALAAVDTIAAEIDTVFSRSQSVTVNYGSAGNAIPISTLFIDNPGAVITSTALSSGASQGTVGTGTPNSVTVTYTHTGTACSDSFQVVGTGSATSAPRTVNVTINPPTGTTAADSTSNIAYSTSPTPLSLTLGPTATGITITSPLNPAVGSLNVSGTSVSYSASSTQYAPSLTFSYRATGPCGTQSSIATVTINVASPPAPVITSASSASGQVNQAFSFQVTATNVATSYAATGTLPAGVSFNTSTGQFSGTPTQVGTFPLQITASNSAGTSAPQSFTLTITPSQPPAITSPATASGFAGVAFSYQIAATNNPTSYNATGLPPGLGVNTASGLISGTPTTTGTFNATVSATNSVGTGSQGVVITISVAPSPPVITSAGSASAQTGVAFTYAITATNNPTSYGATGLPIGLTVDSATGIISGSPGATGTFNATISATNAAGTGTKTLVIDVSVGPPAITSPSSATGTVGQPFAYHIAATNFPTSFGATGLPPGLTVNTGNGLISGTPTSGGTFNVTLSASNATTTVTATVTFVIGFVAPSVANLSVNVAFNTPAAIALPVTGVFATVNIVTPPAHGSLSGFSAGNATLTYTPASGYSGPDSFVYSVTGPGGTSGTATVTLTIAGLRPAAAAATLSVPLNSSATVDLRAFITGSGITGIAIATPPAHGEAAVNGTKVTYTPRRDFFGTDSFTYIAFGNAGDSPPAVVTVTIVGRPDPSRNADVTGLLGAQSATAQRFARAQIGNFQGRLESLHSRPPSPEPPPEPPATTSRAPAGVQVAAAGNVSGLVPSTTSALSSALANSILSLAASQSVGVNVSSANVWVAGTVRFGHRDAVDGTERTRFTTDGVSAGFDRRLDERLAIGAGVGFARDKTDIGVAGSRNDTDGAAAAVYASFHPRPAFFVDGLLGYAKLDQDADRFVAVAGDFARSARKADQWFGSLAAGYEYRHEGLLISPYARLDYASTRFKRATETGAGLNALTYDEQTVPMLEATLGVRAESQHDTRFGAVRPRARLEFAHEFRDDRAAGVSYADGFGTRYTVTPAGVKRTALLFGIGSEFLVGRGMSLGLDYQARRTSGSDIDQAIRLQFTAALDGKGTPGWFAESSMFTDPVRVETGYTYDDNVTRSRDARDILADHVFSVTTSMGHVFPLTANWRVVANGFVGAEEFYRYTGLARVNGGFQAEAQYRASGEFDAITLGVVGRVAGDYYDTPIRRGYRATLALTARQSLTDRIEAFAALTGTVRRAKSGVFDIKEYGAKLNFDYSLGSPNGSLYLQGEFRRGDSVSSGRFSLDNIDIADVFTPDPAFGPGFFAYRFDAKTWLGTLGYNRPLGARDAIDISWRRVQTTPTDRPGFTVPGPFRYIDNQYSIIYLMRF